MNLIYSKTLSISPNSKPTLRVHLKVELPSSEDIHDLKEKSALKQFQHLKEAFPEMDWKLTGKFNFYNDGNSPKLDVALEGDLLKDLHDVLFHTSGRESLQICVTVEVKRPRITSDSIDSNDDDDSDEEAETGLIRAMNMEADSSKRFGKRHSKYLQRQVPLPKLWLCRHTDWTSFENYKWIISVDMDFSNFVDLSGLLNSLELRGKLTRILDEKLFTDFEFISSDGAIIPCHKALISASSPIFMAKCQGKLDEPSRNQMNIDLTENGVRALLGFIYGGEVVMPMINPLIALELFQASHQYGIMDLEKVISEIFLRKHEEWWELGVAFDLFRFLVNYEGESCERLKRKVVHIVAMKSDDLGKSEMFETMLQGTPQVASQMFTLMAFQLKSKHEELRLCC